MNLKQTLTHNYALYKLLTLAVILGLLSCDAKTTAPIRLGVNVWPGYEYLFLAETLGYYEEQGLNIQLVETSSLDDLRRAFERGKIDGMASSIVEVVLANANSGRVPNIFMVPDFSFGGDVIVAQKGISTPASLKGKRVGLELDSLGEYIVSRAMNLSGSSLDQAVVAPMSQEAMFRAMQHKDVDAVMTYPPVSNMLLENLDAHIIFSTADIPGEVADVVSLEEKVIIAHPEVPIKILRAWQKALNYANENPDRAFELSALRQATNVSDFKDSLAGVKLLSLPEQKALLVDTPHILIDAIKHISDVVLAPEEKDLIVSPERFIYTDALTSEFDK